MEMKRVQKRKFNGNETSTKERVNRQWNEQKERSWMPSKRGDEID